MGKQKNTLLTPDIKEYIDISIKKNGRGSKRGSKRSSQTSPKATECKNGFQKHRSQIIRPASFEDKDKGRH